MAGRAVEMMLESGRQREQGSDSGVDRRPCHFGEILLETHRRVELKEVLRWAEGSVGKLESKEKGPAHKGRHESRSV